MNKFLIIFGAIFLIIVAVLVTAYFVMGFNIVTCIKDVVVDLLKDMLFDWWWPF